MLGRIRQVDDEFRISIGQKSIQRVGRTHVLKVDQAVEKITQRKWWLVNFEKHGGLSSGFIIEQVFYFYNPIFQPLPDLQNRVNLRQT